MDRSQQPARLRATIASRRAEGLPWGRRPVTAHDQDIAARLAAGESLRGIARALRCSFQLVRRAKSRLTNASEDAA
jgi:DNA invertase Pin-like site-specific DNA recombinase